MSEWGGKREGAGRRRGSSNPNTERAKAEIRAAMAKYEPTIPDLFEGDAVGLMQLIYKDPRWDISVRLDAAKSAAKFERPTLQAVLTKDVSPIPTTPSGIDDAISLLMRKARGYVDVDGSGSAAGAPELESGGQDGAVEVT